ncbi:MAG: DNA polymerase III subunit chi [Halobacteria archaeon]|nr:DNA polymerase III subunit chi [Halobacteria archaeon]
MTRVDFYILEGRGPTVGPAFACRLVEKAYAHGHQVYINTDSAAQLRQLDDLLWSFRGGSFLPHAIYDQAVPDKPAILLGHATEPRECNDVLVNLAQEVPPFFSRFNRMAELVDGDDAQRAAARERFRFYKDRGYTLETHSLQAY